MKRILVLMALLLALSASLFAFTACGEEEGGNSNQSAGGGSAAPEQAEGLKYGFNSDGTCYVAGIGSYKDEKVIRIPAEIYGKKVTAIGNRAFAGCENISSIVLPESIKIVGNEAFWGCTGLNSISINEGVEAIGEDAFYNCYNLVSVTIPKSVKSIGAPVLSGANGLVVPDLSVNVAPIGGRAFTNCYKLIEVINLSSLKIEAGSDINGGAGRYAKKVHKGESVVVNYNNYLFFENNGKNYVIGYVGDLSAEDAILTLPEDYNGAGYSIYDRAFYGYKTVTSITVPACVEKFGKDAFYGCEKLSKSVYIEGIKEWCDIEFANAYSSPLIYGAKLNLNNSVIGELVIPAEVTSIPAYAFKGQTDIKKVTIHADVTSIGGYAFDGCTNAAFFCEESGKLGGWSSAWNSTDRPVLWGYKEENLKTTEDGFVWMEINGEACIVDFSGNATLTIPEEIDGLAVTKIFAYAFDGLKQNSRVTFGVKPSECEHEYVNGVCTKCSASEAYPYKWYQTTSGSGWQNKTSGKEMKIANAATNGKNLKENYVSSCWYRI